MRRRTYLMGTASAIGLSSAGVMAFTTASVSRNVEIAVAADDSGVIGLTPGQTEAAQLASGGNLSIDTSTENSDGLNVNGQFTYGDENAPTGNYTFALTNNDNTTRDFDISFSTSVADGVVTFNVYEEDESLLGEVTADTDLTTSLDVGDTVYVILDVDTSGMSDGDDIGGTLNIGSTE